MIVQPAQMLGYGTYTLLALAIGFYYLRRKMAKPGGPVFKIG